jgi:AcrR family transcriptional regulator
MPGLAEREGKRDDRRSRRTRKLLIEAFMALMLEKRYDSITVQEIIDRANVGRSTFYAHYQDKDDLRQDQVAELVSNLSMRMERGAGGHEGNRIIPSLQLLRHVRDSPAVYRALSRGRAMEAVHKPMQIQLSLYVETRLGRLLPAGTTPTVPLPVMAQYVVGVLLTLFQWWLDREMLETPEQLNEYFLQLVRPSVRSATGVEI